jgi:opacity protein-like surface antigen
MDSLRAGALAGAIVIMTATAQASEVLPPPPMIPYAQQAAVVGTGWYLRGDVGISEYEGGRLSTPNLPTTQFFAGDFGSGSLAGLGVGYEFNDWFRGDITGEYRFSKGFKAFERVDFDAGGVPGVTRETVHGDYSGFLFLANAYIDLGTWLGVTPFVGAGAGLAHNRLFGFSGQSITEIPVGGTASPSAGWFGDGSSTSFAWALHAGFAYDVTPSFVVEMAYRYANLGEMRTGVVDCFCGQTFSPLKVKDVESHDFRVGMRWLLHSSAFAPAAPMIRRY